MQQLTLQFEGYADSRPVIDAGTAKQCNRKTKATDLSVGWALRQLDPAAALDSVMACVKTLAQAVLPVLYVCFSFSLMYLAALIGG